MLGRRQRQRRPAHWAGLLTLRPAGCSPAERRRRSPPMVQGYQQAPYSPCLPARPRWLYWQHVVVEDRACPVVTW